MSAKQLIITNQESKIIAEISPYSQNGKELFLLKTDFSLPEKPSKQQKINSLSAEQIKPVYSTEYQEYFQPNKYDPAHLQYFSELGSNDKIILDSRQNQIGRIVSHNNKQILHCDFFQRPYDTTFTATLDNDQKLSKKMYERHLNYLHHRLIFEYGNDNHLNPNDDFIYSIHDYHNKYEKVAEIRFKETKTGKKRYYVFDPYIQKTVSKYFADIRHAGKEASSYSKKIIKEIESLKISKHLDMFNMALNYEQELIYEKGRDLELDF